MRRLLLGVALVLGGPAVAHGEGAKPAVEPGVTVVFHVTVPGTTPEDDVVWIAGDLPLFGAWSGRGMALTGIDDGRRRGAEFTLPKGTRLEYKMTRGSWETVEKDARGGEIANRVLQVTRDTTVEITVLAWRDQVPGGAAPGPARRTTLTGDVRTHASFASKHVAARDVWVWLPPGYATETKRRYPVVYFHDGNNVFDERTSFLGIEWGVDETAGRLVKAGTLPPFIAVAVANTPARMDEYTPVRDPHHGGGEAAKYGRFLLEELKPFVDATYRTDPRPAATGVVGSSLGAVVSLWLGLEHPGTFTRIGAVSPAAWFAGGDLVRRVADGRGAGLRVWIDIGTAEGTSNAGRRVWLDDARALRDALVARGYRLDADLHYEEVEGAVHNEAAWAARVDRMLAFLLADLPEAP